MHEYPADVEEQFRRDARRFGDPLPKRIANKPALFFGMALYLNAWFELDSERKRPEPISRSMCFQYAHDYDLSEEQRDDLWYFMQRTDNAFLTWWSKRQRSHKPKKGQQGDGKS